MLSQAQVARTVRVAAEIPRAGDRAIRVSALRPFLAALGEEAQVLPAPRSPEPLAHLGCAALGVAADALPAPRSPEPLAHRAAGSLCACRPGPDARVPPVIGWEHFRRVEVPAPP
jgi:hypothetical protein